MNILPLPVLPEAALTHRIAMPPRLRSHAGTERVPSAVEAEWHRRSARTAPTGTAAARVSGQAGARRTFDPAVSVDRPVVGNLDYPLRGEAAVGLVRDE